jgi:hypothetical protein
MTRDPREDARAVRHGHRAYSDPLHLPRDGLAASGSPRPTPHHDLRGTTSPGRAPQVALFRASRIAMLTPRPIHVGSDQQQPVTSMTEVRAQAHGDGAKTNG